MPEDFEGFESNGVTVFFDGIEIGNLVGYDWEAKVAELVDKTHAASQVIGTGANSRVVKEYDATAVVPVLFSFSFNGPPSFSIDDRGLKAELLFEAPGQDPIAGEAILMDFRRSGRSGKWSNGTATFQMTGTDAGS